jgi:hypothetical protein
MDRSVALRELDELKSAHSSLKGVMGVLQSELNTIRCSAADGDSVLREKLQEAEAANVGLEKAMRSLEETSRREADSLQKELRVAEDRVKAVGAELEEALERGAKELQVQAQLAEELTNRCTELDEMLACAMAAKSTTEAELQAAKSASSLEMEEALAKHTESTSQEIIVLRADLEAARWNQSSVAQELDGIKALAERERAELQEQCASLERDVDLLQRQLDTARESAEQGGAELARRVEQSEAAKADLENVMQSREEAWKLEMEDVHAQLLAATDGLEASKEREAGLVLEMQALQSEVSEGNSALLRELEAAEVGHEIFQQAAREREGLLHAKLKKSVESFVALEERHDLLKRLLLRKEASAKSSIQEILQEGEEICASQEVELNSLRQLKGALEAQVEELVGQQQVDRRKHEDEVQRWIQETDAKNQRLALLEEELMMLRAASSDEDASVSGAEELNESLRAHIEQLEGQLRAESEGNRAIMAAWLAHQQQDGPSMDEDGVMDVNEFIAQLSAFASDHHSLKAKVMSMQEEQQLSSESFNAYRSRAQSALKAANAAQKDVQDRLDKAEAALLEAQQRSEAAESALLSSSQQASTRVAEAETEAAASELQQYRARLQEAEKELQDLKRERQSCSSQEGPIPVGASDDYRSQYLKFCVLQFFQLEKQERPRLLPVIGQLLNLSAEERELLEKRVKGTPPAGSSAVESIIGSLLNI